MDKRQCINTLLRHRVEIDRWWMYKYLGKLVSFTAKISRRGSMVILLKDVVIEREINIIDHIWIRATKNLESIPSGRRFTFTGRVRIYTKGNYMRNFGLEHVERTAKGIITNKFILD